MMVEIDLRILIYLSAYTSILTILIFLARRDFKMGLKKWFMFKTGKQPMVIRYYGANLNVSEHVVSTAGVGDKVDLFDKKWFGLKKTKKGSTFFLNEKFSRRRDDGLNELSYSYKSVSPVSPDKEFIDAENTKIKLIANDQASDFTEDENNLKEPVEVDTNILYTDPKRLNRFIDLVKTSAKAEALEAAGADVLKWAKFATFAAAAAAIMGVLVWYTMDSQVITLLEGLGRQIASIGSGLIEV